MDRSNATSLLGKAAVVTGGSRGIGEGIAIALSNAGASVTLAARNQDELDAAAMRIEDGGGRVDAVRADVTNKLDVDQLMKRAVAKWGHLDILINAAGVYGPIGRTWESDIDDWVQGVQVNLIGTYLCCRLALPYMIGRPGASIVNLSGGGAAQSLPRFSCYAASKAAVVRLTENLSDELKDHGVRVNAVAAGAVDTRLQDQVLAAGDKAGDLFGRIKALRERGEGGVPREVAAGLVVYLCSDDSLGLTGRLISAPYDAWPTWDADKIAEIMKHPWFTLRRLDAFTLKPLGDKFP